MHSRSRRITKEPQLPILAAAFVLLASLALVAPARAQAPMPVDCDTEEPDDSGARINCKFGNLIAQQIETATMMDGIPGLPQNQKDQIMDQAMRASNARGRATDEAFRGLTRRPDPTCQLVEFLDEGMPVGGGNNDGICQMGETCSEVLGDGIGDDDGVCQPRQGARREICVQICDEEGIALDEENFDDDPFSNSRGRDTEDQLDDITDQYVELNSLMGSQAQLQSAASILAANGNSCSALITRRANTTAFIIAVVAADTARGVADILERGCDQTAFGFNGSTVCIVTETVASVARLISTGFEFSDASIDSDTIDVSYECLGDLSTEVGGLTTAVSGLG